MNRGLTRRVSRCPFRHRVMVIIQEGFLLDGGESCCRGPADLYRGHFCIPRRFCYVIKDVSSQLCDGVELVVFLLSEIESFLDETDDGPQISRRSRVNTSFFFFFCLRSIPTESVIYTACLKFDTHHRCLR